MKTTINSLTGKYIINMIMICIFAGLAFSGLFRGGEREYRSHTGSGEDPFRNRRDKFAQLEQGNGERDFFFGDFRPVHRERGMDFHTVAGLIWLFLMALHIWQHWNWFKRLFSFQHIKNNKLLSLTILVFILLAFSGLSLAFDLIPRGLFNVKEVHEFLGQVLGILVVIHCIQRFKWIVATTRNLANRLRLSVSKA